MTVPIYSFDERFIGFQEFRPRAERGQTVKSRYHTYSTQQALWGLNEIPDEYEGIVFLTEAVFRANMLIKHGLHSVALLGSTCSKEFAKKLQTHPKYKFIWVGDPDKSGRFMLKYLDGECSPYDLDEMPEELLEMYVEYLKEKYGCISFK